MIRKDRKLMREVMGIPDKPERCESVASEGPVSTFSIPRINTSLDKSYFDEFWNDRIKDCRLWGLILDVSLILFNITYVLGTRDNETRRYIHFVFLFIDIFAFLMFVYSFKENADLRIAIVPMMLITT